MSPTKKKGLGRGLTALFGDQKPESKKSVKINISRNKVSVADLSPNKYQPRIHFDKEKLNNVFICAPRIHKICKVIWR